MNLNILFIEFEYIFSELYIVNLDIKIYQIYLLLKSDGLKHLNYDKYNLRIICNKNEQLNKKSKS